MKVLISQVGQKTLGFVETFLAQKIGISEAQDFADELLLKASKAIGEHPGMHHKNLEALEKGVELYEWLDLKHQYRVLYTINNGVAEIDIFCSTREDFGRLLYLVMMS